MKPNQTKPNHGWLVYMFEMILNYMQLHWLSLYEMDLVTRVQILERLFAILLALMPLRKAWIHLLSTSGNG